MKPLPRSVDRPNRMRRKLARMRNEDEAAMRGLAKLAAMSEEQAAAWVAKQRGAQP